MFIWPSKHLDSCTVGEYAISKTVDLNLKYHITMYIYCFARFKSFLETQLSKTSAKAFTPGAGVIGAEEDEEEEEECSESETVESLGELSAVDLPGDVASKDTTPTCETQMDKKLLMLAKQFMAARSVNEKKPVADKPTLPRKIATPDPAKLPPQQPKKPSNPNVLPEFAS